jgi:zinc protease
LRTTLDNGLKVVLLEDRSAPVVALNVWVRTGSAEETEAEAGMAHVFEHMLFKGTERRAVGEIARTVEAAGGNINAFTSFDMTVYHITMASRDVAVGIDVLADAILNSTFDPGELDREIAVVLEEIRRGEDSPNRVLSQEMFSQAYTRHPYRDPVIGTSESVSSFSREQLLDFHRRWYVPNNLTFVAVGDFDADQVLEQIRSAFASAEARADLAHPRDPEPEQTEPRSAIVRRDFERTLIGIAYPITAFAEEDTAYVDLLATVLGGGESSPLYRNVKDRRQLVHTIGASAYTPLDRGLFFVQATLDPGMIEHALQAIGEEIDRLRNFGPSDVELERARVNLLSSEVHERETMQGQARKLGYYEALPPAPRHDRGPAARRPAVPAARAGDGGGPAARGGAARPRGPAADRSARRGATGREGGGRRGDPRGHLALRAAERAPRDHQAESHDPAGVDAAGLPGRPARRDGGDPGDLVVHRRDARARHDAPQRGADRRRGRGDRRRARGLLGPEQLRPDGRVPDREPRHGARPVRRRAARAVVPRG